MQDAPRKWREADMLKPKLGPRWEELQKVRDQGSDCQ